MKRRAYLATVGTAAIGSLAGCTGGQVMSIDPGRPIRVAVGRGEIITIPADGDSIKYSARDEQRFSVYFFTAREQLSTYLAFIDGENPEQTPPGDTDIGTHAVPLEGSDLFEAATPDRSWASIDADGETFLVIDHSRYRLETAPADDAGPLSVALDLTVTTSPLSF